MRAPANPLLVALVVAFVVPVALPEALAVVAAVVAVLEVDELEEALDELPQAASARLARTSRRPAASAGLYLLLLNRGIELLVDDLLTNAPPLGECGSKDSERCS